MRTNVTLNDELMEEAVRLSGGRPKGRVLEEALRAYVELKSSEAEREDFRQRLLKLDAKTNRLRLRQRPSELLRQERDRR